MKKYREYMKDKTFTRLTFFLVFTVTLIYISYFVIKNIGSIATAGVGAIGSVISALTPLWIGLILAYLINPLVEGIEKKLLEPISAKYLANTKKSTKRNRKHFVSIIIAYVMIVCALIALVYGFAWMIMGEFVVENITDLFNSLIKLINNYEGEFRSWAAHLPINALSDYAQDTVSTVVTWFTDNFSASGIISKLTNISGAIFDFAIGLIVSIYLMVEKDFFIGIWNKFLYLIMPNRNTTVNNTLHEVNGVLSRFVRGVLLDALFVAILSSIGLSIMGLQFSVFIGIFAGICNVIPYFGPVLGMIPAFIVGFFTEDFLNGVIAVVILLFVQQIDSNIIYPRVVGSSTGLKPLFVLLAVTVGGYYGGILGMILAVPTAGIAQVFIVKWAKKREETLNARFNEASASNANNSDDTDSPDGPDGINTSNSKNNLNNESTEIN